MTQFSDLAPAALPRQRSGATTFAPTQRRDNICANVSAQHARPVHSGSACDCLTRPRQEMRARFETYGVDAGSGSAGRLDTRNSQAQLCQHTPTAPEMRRTKVCAANDVHVDGWGNLGRYVRCCTHGQDVCLCDKTDMCGTRRSGGSRVGTR